MRSALYAGQVRHRRFAPRGHAFSYRLFMVFLDLDELEEVFRGRWLWSTKAPALAWWRREDYLGKSNVPLSQAVRDLVERESGARPLGPIRMLTHLRYFGHSFNPVTFYYCYDEGGETLTTIVAEITNTPWKERHAYVLSESDNEGAGMMKRYRFGKRFHVSPFIGMDVSYDWRFGTPGEKLAVNMRDMQDGHKLFDATLNLSRLEINGANLAKALARFPLMTCKVLGAIYWQAFRLWWKGVPFYPHPRRISPQPTNPGAAGQ